MFAKKVYAIALALSVSVTGMAQVHYSKGLKINLQAYNSIPKKASLIRGIYKELPGHFSLKKYCPRPGNQIQLNTSPAWAVSYGAKTILDAEMKGDTSTHSITMNSYSPVFNYLISTNNKNNHCSVPTTLTGVLEALRRYGTPKYVDFAGFCPDSIPQRIYKLAKSNSIDGYTRLFDSNDAPQFKLNAVKKSLAERLPVIIGMYCPPSFGSAREFWQPREKVSNDFAAQALLVIGYDDSKYGGAFEVLNSWGSNWGNNGYMWIRYPDFLDFTATAYEIFIIGDQQNSIDFSGKIKLVLSDNHDMQVTLTGIPGYYETIDVYPSGTKFRIYLANNESAYIYVFGTDKTNEFFRLFPVNDNISPVLNYKNSNIALPGENYYIELNDQPGNNYLVILYSKEEIQLNNLMNKLKKLPGKINERLNSVMETSRVNGRNINWLQDDIVFSGNGKGKSLLPIYIEIKH